MKFSHLYLCLIFSIIQSLAYTQIGVLEGVLTDNLGSPAAYVNVVSTEQNKGTLTNLDWFYSLEIPANRKTTTSIQGLNSEDLSLSVKLSDG